MNPDPLQQAWQTQTAQTRLTIDADVLLKEVQRNQQTFTATIFWRDVREVGVSLLLIPVWIYMGVTMSLPWTWYLTIPALVWIAGFMLLDRIRKKRRSPESGGSLRQCVEQSRAEIEHQIWLLRNVHWWYLLPIALSILAFFLQCTLNMAGEIGLGEEGAFALLGLCIALMFGIVVIVFVVIYKLDQNAIRSVLQPRRQELESLLVSLNDDVAP